MNIQKRGSTDPQAPLVVLLHGRGSNAESIIPLSAHLPSNATYVAIDAPIPENGGFAWFANRGIGRPIAESISKYMREFNVWLDANSKKGQKVYLVGLSGGGAFAGGLILTNKNRFSGAAILYATLPWDAGISTEVNQLKDFPIFLAQGLSDHVIPHELQDRTWKYLTEESGAKVHSHKGPEGHGLSEESLINLNNWLIHEFK